MERSRIYMPAIVWDFLDQYVQQNNLQNRSIAMEQLVMNAIKNQCPQEDMNAHRTKPTDSR